MYVLVVFALFQSNFYWPFQWLFVFLMSVYFIFLWRIETAGIVCSQIQYLNKVWHVYCKHKSVERYYSARVRFDFGWLMWLVFNNQQETGKSTRRHVLLFRDQLNDNDSRLLRVVLRLQSS
ncbi:MAG: hypothetical protein P1U32_02365 [Legionellaceae bacterium]|nr:hypothetical protein [Legionellaceae bacterium]